MSNKSNATIATMGIDRRREFIAGLGGAVTTWPLAAGGQQAAVPVIGFLNGASAWEYAYVVAAFRLGSY